MSGTRPFPHQHEGRGTRCLACGEPRHRHPSGKPGSTLPPMLSSLKVYRVTWDRAYKIVEAKSSRQAIGMAIPEWEDDITFVKVERMVPADANASDSV